MKAYLLQAAGGIDNLKLSEVEQPTPKEDEVLIQVKAIGLNPVDVKVRPSEEVLTMILGTEERPVIPWMGRGRHGGRSGREGDSVQDR